MLKISRIYLDACGFRDGVFEQLTIKALDKDNGPSHHVIHAPNGVGKTTILALLFGAFEPDRRKFLRTEINRQHRIEHYFLPGRLGVVALELVREGANKMPVRHVIGQVFWMTPASKGDEGEPGQRRFFAFEEAGDLSFETMPFRGLDGEAPLKTIEDFTRWARDMRTAYPGNFFNTDAVGTWRKHLVSDLGVDLRVLEVQRRFCAAEGGIGAAFLDFKTEQQFLEKIFSFMIPVEAAESVIEALHTGLAKIRDLPRRKEQLKVLTQLSDAFAPFFKAAAELEDAEAEHADDLKRLGRLYARLRTEITKLETERATVEGDAAVAGQKLEDARKLERTLEGEVLFLEKTAAERRIEDARSALEAARKAKERAERRLRAARAADVGRRLGSAERTRDDLQAELERIERDLAPESARLGRAGAELHAMLDRLADEADRDADAREAASKIARNEAHAQDRKAREASARQSVLAGEISSLTQRIDDHARDRKQLERAGALLVTETPEAGAARISAELTRQEDAEAELELADGQLQTEATDLERKRAEANAAAGTAKGESERLERVVAEGRKLEKRILEDEFLTVVLAGAEKDPYRPDLPDRVRAARGAREETHRRLSNEREKLASELAFLDASGVSSVPEDVAEVARALRDAGFPDAQPAEHYLAAFMPDADAAMALVRRDPARFTGVFVGKADRAKLSTLAADNRLKLRGPVLVSQAALDATPDPDRPGIVFGPLSAARFNKAAAAAEKAALAAALSAKESELSASRTDLDRLQELFEHIRHLQAAYGARRPDLLSQDKELADRQHAEAQAAANSASRRLDEIKTERGRIKADRAKLNAVIAGLKRWSQDLERFSSRYANIAAEAARLAEATAERTQQEIEAKSAWAAAEAQRTAAAAHDAEAVRLRTQGAAWRKDKRHYPETDGKPADPVSTLDDLIRQYKTAEQLLTSKRSAQSAHVAQRLTDTKEAVLKLTEEFRTARHGLSQVDLDPFSAVADLQRAIAEADTHQRDCHDDVTRAESAAHSADSRSGPTIRKLGEARDRGIEPITVPEFVGATVEVCESEQAAREIQLEAVRREAKELAAALSRLESRRNQIRGSLEALTAMITRAEDHLPEPYRGELPDLSLEAGELKRSLSHLVDRLTKASKKIDQLRSTAEAAFDKVHYVFSAENFRQLEPQVAENLRPYRARSAGAERATLQTRLAERIGVVQTEIENQQRDQNACLEQLRQHVVHADDLLRRAMRCSKIPDHVPSYGGERILKIKRTLRDVSVDIVRHQLTVWLDEQASTGRIPDDGARLAAELLNRVHGGRALEIEILKPKRDAIQPYMRVDRMGLSGGEGVTVAMMLYTVIQKMAMDERADDKKASSGGFLLLDNTYGMSNMLEHVVLQMTMADLLGIQLFVTTCSEDKHVLNMFPTITRLAQGERVSVGGVPQYIRVRAGDYLFREPGYAA